MMMDEEFVRTILTLGNEVLSTAIVVVAASMLLYNLSRNLTDRIARTSAVALGCVTVVYIGDVLIALGPGIQTFEGLLRVQWIGLAYIPAAMFHLSDALLATTGLPSRGRRKRAIRILYAVGVMMLLLAAFSDSLIRPVPLEQRVELDPGPIFWIYLLYFVIANGVAFVNVNRARQRCLTRTTERRMRYLQIAMLTPLLGIFPYSMFLDVGDELSLQTLVLVNIANLVVVLMLLFLSYPLSFFGSRVPDRVVKAELLRFILRGPATALLALIVILFTDPTSRFLGLPGDLFAPFATVTVILVWQWSIDIALPYLERWLIYSDADNDQISKLHEITETSLSKTDLLQLLDAILEATCDYLRVNTAFIATIDQQSKPDIVRSIGELEFKSSELEDEWGRLQQNFVDEAISNWTVYEWSDYWVLPLFSQRLSTANNQRSLTGMMGIEARADTINLDEYDMASLRTWVLRTAQTLDDMMLMTEIYAAIEGLLPQISMNRERAADVEYRPGRTIKPSAEREIPERDEVIEQVRAALRHYWGGPGLSRSRLLDFHIVQAEYDDDTTPTQALQKVLRQGIETLRPEGEPDRKSQEWVLYNILKQRFLEARKARDTARSLYISEANLFRKQNVAIEAVADAILNQEKQQHP